MMKRFTAKDGTCSVLVVIRGTTCNVSSFMREFWNEAAADSKVEMKVVLQLSE